MNSRTLTRTCVATAAICFGTAHADALYTETFEAAPLTNAGYYPGTTVPNTGLEVTSGVAAIFDGGAAQGHSLNLYSGWYSPNFDNATNVGSSTVQSLATFDLLAGYTYTLGYDYSRGFGSGGNGPFNTSLTASFGNHSATYNDVAGFYYGFDWQAGSLTFTQATTELGVHVMFTALAPGGYSSMAIDNITLIGLPPANTGVPPTDTPLPTGDTPLPPTDTPLPTGDAPAAPVPEPSTWALMFAGLGALGWARTRRQR